MDEANPKGQLFTHVYLERGKPQQDSETFRRRIGHYCQRTFSKQNYELGAYLVQEMGLRVPGLGGGYDLERFLMEVDIEHFLNAITLIWRFALASKIVMPAEMGSQYLSDAWLAFVRRVLREENMGYSVDDSGGVHYLIDEEFERNRVSLLSCLENKKYAGVRAAYEDAYRHLDDNPPDTKAAVRSMFESIEILARLLDPSAKRLNKKLVEDSLKPLALKAYPSDEIAQITVDRVFESFALWVDALHNYRHGQGKEEPVTPPLDFTVYVLSSGTSILRWLVGIDSRVSPP